MNNSDVRQELLKGLKSLLSHGYKCYVLKGREYGFIVTPKDNIIYIQKEHFGGWKTSLQCKPSQKIGSGCQCLEEPFFDITVENIEKSEKEGLIFAHKLCAQFYKNSNYYFANYWEKEALTEVTEELKQ